MRASLEVTSSEGGEGIRILALRGELDIDTTRRVEQELRWLEESGTPAIALDLRGLTFMDSTGLRMVVSADGRAREAGRRFVLVRGTEAVHKIFRITTLDKRLDFVDDPAAL